MKQFIILTLVIVLSACSAETNSEQAVTNKAMTINNQSAQNPVKTQAVNTQGVDLSTYMKDDTICSIMAEADLVKMFNVPGKIVTEVEHSGAATCRYSWHYGSLEARKQATNNSHNNNFGQQSKYNARAISNEARLIISLAPAEKPVTEFVPEILSEAVIDAQVEQFKKDTTQLATSIEPSKLNQLAQKRKQALMKKNQMNIQIDAVGDAAYWTQIGGGGLHVLVGQAHVYISPLIATTVGGDIENAIAVLAKIAE